VKKLTEEIAARKVDQEKKWAEEDSAILV